MLTFFVKVYLVIYLYNALQNVIVRKMFFLVTSCELYISNDIYDFRLSLLNVSLRKVSTVT